MMNSLIVEEKWLLAYLRLENGKDAFSNNHCCLDILDSFEIYTANGETSRAAARATVAFGKRIDQWHEWKRQNPGMTIFKHDMAVKRKWPENVLKVQCGEQPTENFDWLFQFAFMIVPGVTKLLLTPGCLLKTRKTGPATISPNTFVNASDTLRLLSIVRYSLASLTRGVRGVSQRQCPFYC